MMMSFYVMASENQIWELTLIQYVTFAGLTDYCLFDKKERTKLDEIMHHQVIKFSHRGPLSLLKRAKNKAKN